MSYHSALGLTSLEAARQRLMRSAPLVTRERGYQKLMPDGCHVEHSYKTNQPIPGRPKRCPTTRPEKVAEGKRVVTATRNEIVPVVPGQRRLHTVPPGTISRSHIPGKEYTAIIGADGVSGVRVPDTKTAMQIIAEAEAVGAPPSAWAEIAAMRRRGLTMDEILQAQVAAEQEGAPPLPETASIPPWLLYGGAAALVGVLLLRKKTSS